MKKSNYKLWSCVVVDDDPTIIAILENYIRQIPKLELAGTYTDPQQAMNGLMQGAKIDFLFLDIKMKFSGLHMAQILENKFNNLIFITAYKEFALEAFKVHCDHYLLKPIHFPRFLAAINDVLKRKHRQETADQKREIDW